MAYIAGYVCATMEPHTGQDMHAENFPQGLQAANLYLAY